MTAWSARSIPVSRAVLAIAAVCALLLALPLQTVVTRYLPDLFVILDGAHRVVEGQVPNRDFHSPLGPLASYIPGAGYALTGSLGAAMPVGMALTILALAPAIAHILSSRLRPLIAIFYGVFLLLILAVPINLGEGVTTLTFAKFYNRIGWAALGALLVMYLGPRRVGPPEDRIDALCASFLTLVLIYTKATYGLAALVFVVFMLFDREQRRWAAMALGIVAVAVLAIELVWGSSFAYVADLRLALGASGWLRGTWGQITDHLLFNFADYVLVILFAGLALTRTRSVRDALFYLGCGVGGFLLINQNFQAWGIITLHAAAAVAAETILRRSDEGRAAERGGSWSVVAGAKLLFIAIVAPTIVHCAMALSLHAAAATVRAGDELDFPNLTGVRLANLWSWSDHSTAVEQLTAVQDGVEALRGLDAPPERVLVLDAANPFNPALGLKPPKGDIPWLQWERTVSATAALPAETLFEDVRIVMEPKPLPESDAEKALKKGESPVAVYGPYLAAHYERLRETTHWVVHRRREAPQSTSCAAPCRLPALAWAARP